MTISILHPSYGRPEMAIATAKNWIAKANQPGKLEYIMCVSVEDPTLIGYATPYSGDIKTIYCDVSLMVNQVNMAARNCRGSLLVAISDDFDCPHGWDDALRAIATDDCVIKTQDGIQPDIVTLPIMSRKYYERYGYIYHPDYKHFYGDEELYRVAKQTGKLIRSDLMFEHIHHVAGKAKKDATNEKNSTHFREDKRTFYRREAAGFDIKM